VLLAHRLLLDAYNTDVRPLCAKVREDLGASADPIYAIRESGYHEKVVDERLEGAGAGWGYKEARAKEAEAKEAEAKEAEAALHGRADRERKVRRSDGD
jgi:hypothetical protein